VLLLVTLVNAGPKGPFALESAPAVFGMVGMPRITIIRKIERIVCCLSCIIGSFTGFEFLLR